MGASAFSTEIARVLKTRLPRSVPTHSFHAFGRQILTAFRGELTVNAFKCHNLVQTYLNALSESRRPPAPQPGGSSAADDLPFWWGGETRSLAVSLWEGWQAWPNRRSGPCPPPQNSTF